MCHRDDVPGGGFAYAESTESATWAATAWRVSSAHDGLFDGPYGPTVSSATGHARRLEAELSTRPTS